MPMYVFECEHCGEFEASFPMADRPDETPCLTCEKLSPRVITVTGLVTKGAYLDGTKRKGWAEMREASKLNRELGKHRHASEDRKRIEKQIRQLTGGSLRRD